MSVNKQELIQKRAQYVQEQIKIRGGKVEAVVNELAAELFLDQRTIWRDYTRDIIKTNTK